MKERWEKERDLVNRIRESAASSKRPSPVAAVAAGAAEGEPLPLRPPMLLRGELATLNTELEALQGETPLMRVCVDAQIVGEVISGWTGIPIGKMLKDEVAIRAHSSKSTWAAA